MGSKVILSKIILYFDFVIANSADSDEIPHDAAFNLGLQFALLRV